MGSTLVLLRHGQSDWNQRDLFTGWVDVDLTDRGEEEARRAGFDLAGAGIYPGVVHTSLQIRSVRTCELALREMKRSWVPVRRSWRLNERHYGDLQGKNKTETATIFGEDQVALWRRSYDIAPPELPTTDSRWGYDDRYRFLPPELLPGSECLRDVVERVRPYWYDNIVPDLLTGRTVLIAGHGNSLRALVKHLEGISDTEIPALEIPTGRPLVYELDEAMRPLGDPDLGNLRGRYLGNS